MTAHCGNLAHASRCGGVLAYLCALLVAGPALAAGPTVTMMSRDGDRVQDVAQVGATATTDDPEGIQKVEFLVDGVLKGTDTSTPYALDWDTLDATEGDHTVTARAYDTMRTATASVRLTVDNELTRGAAYHAGVALEAAAAGNDAAATRAARRALKLEPTNVAAARAVAVVQVRARNVPAAIRALEAAAVDASDTTVRSELITLYAAMAAEAASASEIVVYGRKAVEAHRARMAAMAAAPGSDASPTASCLRRGDAAFVLCEWKAAIDEYQKCGTPDTMPMEAANRLLLAYLQAGRGKDADKLLKTLRSYQRADEVTAAVAAYGAFCAHKREQARADLASGGASNALPALLLSGYTELALDNRKDAIKAINQAHELAPELPAVRLLRSYVLTDAAAARQELFDALSVNPMLPQAYAILGYQALLSKQKDHYATADALLGYAASLDPSNQLAVMGRALSALAQERPAEAQPHLARLRELDPVGPDVNIVYAYYYSLIDDQKKLAEELKAAAKSSPDRWGVFLLPKAADLIRDVFRYRYSPLLTPSALYPGS